VIAQIVLYRMFYVTGPVLGWALKAMRSSYLRGRFPIETLVRAIDELGSERPELIEHLLDSIYATQIDSIEEYDKRLAYIRDANSWAGRAAGFELLTSPVDDNALMAETVALIVADLDDDNAGKAAENVLYRLIISGDKTHAAFDKLVKARNESLSDRVKREYIRRNPETELLDTSEPYYWTSEPKREFDPEMQKLIDDWEDGIGAAVDQYRSIQSDNQGLRDEARKLDVSVFQRETPATLPLGAEYVQEQEEERQAEEQQDRQQDEMERVQNEFTKRMEEISEKMMANMDDQQAIQKLSQEMTALSADMQKKIQKLAEG
ncbi:MAG: hypothetical protein V3V10_07800, partial [Planctomycetota bacterium]